MKAMLLVATTVGLAAAQTEWPIFHGDWSGRRYSQLAEIDTRNVANLSLAWATRYTSTNAGTGIVIKSPPILKDGILYFTSPNNLWAADVRTGREIWHYTHPQNTGNTNGNRGIGIYGDWLFFETPDSNLLSFNRMTGKLRWKVQIANPKLDYTSTAAPMVIRNHVLVGIGGDHLDNPGFLESRDPETGDLQWRWWTTPRKGEPGIESWPDEQAAIHGTGQTWIPGTYDPELNLYYLGTGNPNPVMAGASRKGDNLYTCTIVALNPDTGKLVWHYQVSPHDVHDWDATEISILIDGTIDGKPRKLLAQASRNGYYFLLDRTNGQHLVTKPFIDTVNWSKGMNTNGTPVPDPAKFPSADGRLVSPSSDGATNWAPPSFSPDTGLFYVGASKSVSMFYLTDTDDKPEGWAGLDKTVGNLGNALLAIDYRTGNVKWSHSWTSGNPVVSMLTTAGNLLFTSNNNNLIAFDSRDGKILWHAGLTARPSAGMTTYMLDGRQYILVAAGDTLWAFTMPKPVPAT